MVALVLGDLIDKVLLTQPQPRLSIFRSQREPARPGALLKYANSSKRALRPLASSGFFGTKESFPRKVPNMKPCL